ncbi:MAG: mechanosensitive ion channel family protein [Nitrososphaerales archaeon]
MVELIPGTINILGTEIELLKLLITAVIIGVGVLVARLVRVMITRVLGKYIPDETEVVVKRVIYWGIIGVAAFSAIGNLGVDFTGVMLAGGIIGIVIGFATQSVVANLFSGIFLQLDRPVKIGDPIEVVDMNVAGVIKEITPFSTRLRRFDGVLIRIPNEKIFTSQIRNFFGHVARRVEVTVGIAYKEDAATAIELIKEMAARNPKVFAEPAPNIMVWELADSSVNINVWVWVPSPEWFPVRTQIMRQLKELLDNAGIEIPFPHRTLWFGESKTGEKDTLAVAVREAGRETAVAAEAKAGLVTETKKRERGELSKGRDRDTTEEGEGGGAEF